MDILGVTYSAKIDLSPSTFAQVHTMFYGGTWQWFGYVHEVESVDELLIKHTKIVSKVESAVGLFWVSSEDALADAIAQFYTELESDSSGAAWSDDSSAVAHANGTCPDDCNWCISGVSLEDAYPSDVLPTGWDAQDHKAMYE